MTENNSEFAQEPEVGSSAGDNAIVEEHPSEDSAAKLNLTYIKSPSNFENENCNTVTMNEECDSRLSNSGCEHELPSLQDHWLKLSTFFRRVYHSILDGEKPPNEYESHVTIVQELVASDPHQLFARLEMDLQEFIIEVKLRQLELLNCVHTHEGPQLFIFCLIESYNKLMFAASTLSPLLSQLEKEHLAKFDISWRGLNQHLFHKLVFTDPKIQKVIPLCISKLGKMNSKLSDFNKKLIRQFLNFDGEMIRIGAKWREAESSIIKYHQENSMLDAKERMMKVNWELIKTQSKVFHEELKSSGISSDVGSDILSNGHIMNSSSDGSTENIFNYDNDKKPVEIKPAQIQTTPGAVKPNSDFDEQDICESCHLDASRCLGSSVPVNFESSKESKIVSNTEDLNEILDEDLEILTHLNAEGRKMYSHLHKFKAQQVMNGGENVCTESMEFSATDASAEPSSKNQETLPSATSSSSQPSEVQKTAVRKQVIQQQQQQKKIMQMIQTSPQKDIHQKLQKQLQEQQILMQQQRKIEELQNHILQQHPLHMDKEMQKKMHMQMQQCLMQKHKQMEEKFHQQVQQHMQQHQEKPSIPASSTKSIKTVKDSCCQNFNHKCSTSVTPTTSTSYLVTKSSNSNPVAPPVVRAPPSKTVTTNVSTTTTNVTHKNSTTQTPTTPMDGQNRAHHHPLPDVVKSASYVCPKHSDGTIPNAHNHIEHDNCSDNSSDEDYSSERSSSPQRHCDCCYCEVFGSAPVRRNYQETRERLRSILNKKKAKSNAAAAATDGKVSSADPAASITGSVSRAASQGSKPKKDDAIQDKANPPLEYKGDKSIEEILDFIEGNKNRNLKRTAKKMRRKQRQLEEEERRRKEEEEAERLRLEELRRQEEAEKRRQEEERRRQEQLLREQNRKKNKKKGAKPTTNQLNMKLSQAAAATQAGKKSKNQNNVTNDRLKSTLQNSKTVRDQTNQRVTVNQQSQKSSNATQKKQANAIRPEMAKPQPAQKQQQPQSKQKVAEKQKPVQLTKKNIQKKDVVATSAMQKNGSETKDPAQPQMVTIKRVMQPNSSEPTVTITLRGPTPKDDKVLYTLLNGQMCQVKDDKNKKQASANSSASSNVSNVKKSKPANNNVKPSTSLHAIPPPQMLPPKNVVNFNKNCSIVGNGVNSITERMERLKLGPLPVTHEQPKRLNVPSTSPAELTTPTAIQINQAVNQLSARPTFPNNFDLENIKLPPGITITKVDPATVQRRPIQVKQQPAPQPVPQTHIRQNMMQSVPGSSNVIVVDTVDKNNYYQSGEQAAAAGKKKRRKRRKNLEMMAGEAPVPTMPYGAHNGGLPPRMGPFGTGMFGNPFMNAAGYGNMAAPSPQQPAAIIQMNGSMVTIRNPAVHRAYGGPPMDYQDGGKMKMQNFDDKMLSSPPAEMENGDIDDYERELEAFKRFCSQSVPAESKAKVNLNIEDIVLKKKGPVIGCS